MISLLLAAEYVSPAPRHPCLLGVPIKQHGIGDDGAGNGPVRILFLGWFFNGFIAVAILDAGSFAICSVCKEHKDKAERQDQNKNNTGNHAPDNRMWAESTGPICRGLFAEDKRTANKKHSPGNHAKNQKRAKKKDAETYYGRNYFRNIPARKNTPKLFATSREGLAVTKKIGKGVLPQKCLSLIGANNEE